MSIYSSLPTTDPDPSTGTTQTSGGTRVWESVRREARQLEAEIDQLLAQYNRSALSSTSSALYPPPGNSVQELDSVERNLDDLLRKLTDVVAHMDQVASTSSNPNHTHLLQRHRSNLLEYNKEFRKAKSQVASSRQHSELLGNVSGRSHRPNTAEEAYVGERHRLGNAHDMADEVIQQALDTRADLESQRAYLDKTRGRMSSVSNRFPEINQLMGRITSRKYRDRWIMGSVIGICSFLLILYIFR